MRCGRKTRLSTSIRMVICLHILKGRDMSVHILKGWDMSVHILKGRDVSVHILKGWDMSVHILKGWDMSVHILKGGDTSVHILKGGTCVCLHIEGVICLHILKGGDTSYYTGFTFVCLGTAIFRSLDVDQVPRCPQVPWMGACRYPSGNSSAPGSVLGYVTGDIVEESEGSLRLQYHNGDTCHGSRKSMVHIHFTCGLRSGSVSYSFH